MASHTSPPHRVRAIVGGQCPPLILFPGWPQRVEALKDIFFTPFSTQFPVPAVDPPGLADSRPPLYGHDTLQT